MEKAENFNCQLYCYDDETLEISVNTASFFVNYAKDFISNSGKVRWLNFHNLKDKEAIDTFCSKIGIDKLQIEKLYQLQKRPKLEEYPDFIIFTVKSALSKGLNSFFLSKDNISFVLSYNSLISFQEKTSNHFANVRDRIENKRGKIRSKGPDFLLYRMLEGITDNYFEVLDDISQATEKIEFTLYHSPKNSRLRDIETQKRKLIELRKIVFPMKEMATQLEKIDSPFLDIENRYYFSEIKDNCLTVLEEIEGNKQILEGLSNLYFAIQGQRMNEIVKLLTLVSSIFIPLTFIVGVYGMNFDNMPELRMKYGYFIAWGIMVLITIILLLVFNKKGWFTKLNK